MHGRKLRSHTPEQDRHIFGGQFQMTSISAGLSSYPAALVMSLKVIHVQSIFLIDFYLKRLIYVQKYGITHQTAMQQGIQEKEEFLQ